MNNNKFLKLISLFFITFILNSCDTAEPPIWGDIYPLTPGNKWIYKIEHPTWIDGNFVTEIIGTMDVTYKGKKYKVAKIAYYNEGESIPDYQWLKWKGPDGIYNMGGVSSTDTFIVKELELKYPANVGDKWQVSQISYSRDRLEFYISDTLDFQLFSNNEILETPADTFKCIVYGFIKWPAEDVAIDWTYKYYYNVNIGLVGNITVNEYGEIKEKYSLKTYTIF